MKNVIFNTNYTLKSDGGRVLVLARYYGRDNRMPAGVISSFEALIHPLYAQILSFFNGDDMEVSIQNASISLNIDPNLIRNFIYKIYNKDKFLSIRSKDGVSVFPPFCIVDSNEDNLTNRFDYKSFKYDFIDLKNRRYFTPSNLTLMVNNRCYTNCFYCYADRRNKIDCQIPFSRMKELIDEAVKLDVKTIDVIGGEFFLYEYWFELVEYLYSQGYHPYLSTKKPMEESDVLKLTRLGVEDIQISLDTLITDHLSSMIGVTHSYVNKIMNTLDLLEKHDINFFIHTVLTCKNDSVEDMKSIFNSIKDYSHLLEWKIDTAGKSMYLKEDYERIASRQNNISDITLFIDSVRSDVDFAIRNPKPATNISFLPKPKSMNDFFNRANCSANYSGLFILPDGQVTICEELYWNPHFLVGNILNQSIEEIWNSQKALDLFYINQKNIPKESLCSTCDVFRKCRSVKQVCYKEILKKYGEDKWYYPDILCPKCNDN
ncbi:radical SAM protein [Parabacteroides acidifaciens]|nr:radical SAM protein [Parabacteroides acidifaciens]MBC8602227.1 radical SAM protein [Parabacteroides acidifaciens]